MKSSRKQIIHNRDVEGIMFCSPQGFLEKDNPSERQEKEDLKALETFWYQKGLKEGESKGIQKGREEGEKEGFQKGFQEGHQKGKEEGEKIGRESNTKESMEKAQEEFHDTIDLLKKSTDQLLHDRDSFLEKSKETLIAFTLSICEKILKQQLSNPDIFSKVVEKLLVQAKSIAHKEQVQILFSPQDLNLLESRLQLVEYDKHNITQLDFLSEPSIPQGSLRIESSLGIINFDVQRELDNFNEELKEN